MIVTKIMGRSISLQCSPNEIRGVTKTASILVTVESLVVCSVDVVGVGLWSREYRVGTARCECSGTGWASRDVVLRPAIGDRTRPTDAGLRLLGVLAESACEYVQKSNVFSMAALESEKHNATAMLQWQRREMLDLTTEVERLSKKIKDNEDVLDLPDVLTPDEHRLAAALIASGHRRSDAVMAAKALVQ